jgi:hypothetical protein
MNLETTDGIHRQGKITGLVYRDIEFNGQVVSYPIEMEVNKDPNDLIPFDRVLRLNIQPDIKEIDMGDDDEESDVVE